MKKMRVIVQAKLVVGYWESVPMESGSDNSSEQDTDTVTKELEELAAKRMMNLCWKEETRPRMKKSIERRRNTAVNGLCDEDRVTRMTVINCLKRIGSRQIKFENSYPPGKQALILQRQVKYVEDIIVTRDTANLGMSIR